MVWAFELKSFSSKLAMLIRFFTLNFVSCRPIFFLEFSSVDYFVVIIVKRVELICIILLLDDTLDSSNKIKPDVKWVFRDGEGNQFVKDIGWGFFDVDGNVDVGS